MRRAGLAFILLALLGACAKAGASDAPAPVRAPVVVELFESQGCSSCPPTNANVNALAGQRGVLTLIYGVTYWDQLGWIDTFARPEFTARQWDYAHELGHRNVYTPQVVLNGRTDLVGNRRPVLDAAIARAAATQFSASVAIVDNRADVSGEGPRGGAANVWLVRYDPQTLDVPIHAGENSGRTLPHTHVVRELQRLGAWQGAPQSYALPAPSRAGLESVVLVQLPNGGPIIGVGASA